jgi:hypothetical protein
MTLTIAGEPLVAYLLASVRIGAWLAVVPPFAGRSIPTMVKVVLSLGLAFAVVPTGQSIPVGTIPLLLNVGTQVLIGVSMGFVTYLLFAAIAAAGSLIDVVASESKTWVLTTLCSARSGWSSSSESEPCMNELLLPKPSARPARRALNFFSSTWLIANITMNRTMRRVSMSA